MFQRLLLQRPAAVIALVTIAAEALQVMQRPRGLDPLCHRTQYQPGGKRDDSVAQGRIAAAIQPPESNDRSIFSGSAGNRAR